MLTYGNFLYTKYADKKRAQRLCFKSHELPQAFYILKCAFDHVHVITN